MRKLMKKIAVALLVCLTIILYPAGGLAAELNVNLLIVRQEGNTCGEIWLDNVLMWRLVLLSDGAKPVVSKGNNAKTTLVIPDIIKGMFVLKLE